MKLRRKLMKLPCRWRPSILPRDMICTDEDAHPRHVLRTLGRSPEGAKWNGVKQPATDSAAPPGRDMAGCHCNEG
jgi:hypothetical protein